MSGRERKRQLSKTEARLWQKVTENVTARAERKLDLADFADEMNKAPVPTFPHPDRAPQSYLKKAISPRPVLKPLENGSTQGVDKRTMEKMRKGKLPIERRLDLHGLTQDQAHRALMRFIDQSYQSQMRCVSVITGKGTRLSGEIGILRRQVPIWLNQPALRPKILAFCYAPAHAGGEGALYVLIKRMRA